MLYVYGLAVKLEQFNSVSIEMASLRAKVHRHDTDYKLCLLCQEAESQESLIGKPRSHETVLKCIRTLSKYGYNFYPEICRRISDITVEELINEGATWHRTCYLNATQVNTIQWARKSYEKQITESSKLPRPFSSASSSSFTRSQSVPYNSDVCFFCDKIGTRRDPLSSCRTTGASLHLHSAIEKSKNEAYRVELNTTLNPTDAHAIDVQYHNKCWSHNVTRVLRKVDPECGECETADKVAADIEFISLAEETLLDGMVLSMADLHATYINTRTSNCVRHPDCSREKVQMLLVQLWSMIAFSD